MKQRIRLTEGDLHRIVKESVNRILDEVHFNPKDYSGRKTRTNANNPLSDLEKGMIDTEKMARYLYPDHTPQSAKDELLRKLHKKQAGY